MIRTILIDDQKSYRNKLRKLIETKLNSQLTIIGEAENIIEGRKLIDALQPDLLFLDIEMPGGSGFDLLEQLGTISFDVIFTTAHDEFAIRAIKFSAIDYLLKPIEEVELINAINKHENKNTNNNEKQFEILFQTLKGFNNPLNQIGLPTSNGLIFIKLNDIIRCQSSINYTDFFLVGGSKITVSRTLKEVESLLSELTFLRVHDSHIINLRHIKKYIKGDGGIAYMDDGSEIDISRRKKDEFKKRLSELKMVFN